jgi:osmotically-inducible protein OsmY
MQKTDKQIQHDVQHALDTDQYVDATALNISVDKGVVGLEGCVSSTVEKEEVETAVKQIAGVKAVTAETTDQPPENIERTDQEIALVAIQHLKRHAFVPEDRLLVAVHNGWITIEGDVTNNHQKLSAENAVIHLSGVRGVTNALTVKAEATPDAIHAQIEAAFARRAKIEAGLIQVELQGNTVILQGSVRSQANRGEAEAAARAAPGVFHVENKLTITPPR